MGREAYFDRVNGTWARHYKVEVELLAWAGTTVIEEDYESPMLVLYAIQQHVFAQSSASLLPFVERVVSSHPGTVLTAADFLNAWGITSAKPVPHSYVLHLYPPDFNDPSPDFEVRHLTPADTEAFMRLLQAISADERQEADIQMGQTDICGAFVDGELRAVGSTYEFRGFVDPGVLTHPDYRRRGLGKAIVAHMARRVIACDELMIYRCFSQNTGSYKLALALGFTPYINITGFVLDQLPVT